jgi:7,8-dihydroneopterin aldolase/epimerase/oxygenase
VETRCGLHPWERYPENPNRLKISVDLFIGLPNGRLSQSSFINYDGIREFLRTFPSRPHTDLLETLAEDIVEKCFENPRIEACRVSVLKPDIYAEADGAGIEVFRTRASWSAE